MMTWCRAAVLAAGIASLAAPAAAQWPAYPTRNVPKNGDGTPNMSAPAPRADGHPDLTGLWEIYFSSIAPAPPPGEASPSRSLQDQSSDGGGGGGDQLGLTPAKPPDDPNAPPRATFF